MDLQLTDYAAAKLSPFPCTACHLSLCNKKAGIGFRGSVHPKVLFVTESTGRDDVKTGTIFSGKIGQYLEDAIVESGIALDACAFTSIVQCAPLKDTALSAASMGNIRAPSEDEVIACQPRLMREIMHLKPKIIVPIGTFASQFFLGRGKKKSQFKAQEVRGKLFETNIAQICFKIFPTIHPGAILRNPSMESGFKNDMAVLATIVQDTFGVDLPKTTVIYDTFHALEVIQSILDAYANKEITCFAMDFETSTMHPWQSHGRILGAALAIKKGHAWYIPFYEHGKGLEDDTYFGNMDYALVTAKLKQLIETVPWKNQNVKFDFGWAIQKWNAHPIFLAADSMVDAFLLYGELRMETRKDGDGTVASADGFQGKGNFSLKALARDFLKYPDYDRAVKEWMHKTDPPTFANIPLSVVAPYAGIDAEAVLRLVDLFEPEILENKLTFARQISNAATHVFSYIELNGVAMDLQYLEELKIEFPQKVLQRYKDLVALPIVQLKLEEVHQQKVEKRRQLEERYALVKSKKKKLPLALQSELKHWSQILEEVQPHEIVNKLTVKKIFEEIGFNPSSAPQIANIVFERFALPPQKGWESKKTNKPSVSKKVVKAISDMAKKDDKYAELNAFTSALLLYREDKKIQSSYIESLPHFITPFGVLHSNYDVIGTRTGRLSTTNFSLHTTPKAGRSPIKKLIVSRWKDPLAQNAIYAQN